MVRPTKPLCSLCGVVRRAAALLLIALAAVLASGCGGGGGKSKADQLSSYLSSVRIEQSAYRQAQKGALKAMDIVSKPSPTNVDCKSSASLIRTARDDYARLGTRLRGIRPPGDLRTAHGKLVQSLQLYSRYFDELQQIVSYCNARALIAASYSSLPGQANKLRSGWRTAVTASAAKFGVTLPSWANEVGRP
jgi:hypothetical protein